MRGTVAVAGTLIAGGAAHDKQREYVDQQPVDVIDVEATSRRLHVTAVLLFVTLVQVVWVSALGYGVFVLVQ